MNRLFKTKFGWCGLAFQGQAIRQIVLPAPDKHRVMRQLYRSQDKTGGPRFYPSGNISGFISALKRYFNGEKVDFRGRIDLKIYSAFERAVYRALVSVRYGQTRSYSRMAELAGCPGAGRAVGNTLAKNRLPPVIPCHRVVRSNGGPGGFSAIAGTRLKKKLLELEKAL